MDSSNSTSIHELIMKNLYFQKKTGRFCDIRLSLGKQFAWIHSTVLCAISPYISRECCNSVRCPKLGNYKTFSFNSPLTIQLQTKDDSDCFKCLQVLIDIIYGQNITVEPIHSPHIHALCKLLSFSDSMISSIVNQLNIKNYQREIETELIFKPEKNYSTEEKKVDVSDSFSILSSNSMTQVDKCIKRDRKKTIPRAHIDLSYLKVLSGKMQSCIGCQYKCYKPSDLLTHLRKTGHGDNVCSLCFAETDSHQELGDHYSLHDDPKPFFCTFCDVRFQTRTLLSQHLPRHSSETPYTCPHCKKGFKWKHGLNSHLMTHSNEKKHLCDECGFSTTHAKTLRAHKLTHTGELFRCSYPGCMHTSSRKENMKIHLGTHNKDKPFVCEICGHKFTQSKSLKRHALIHRAGGFLNICPHCPFKALRTDNLKAHILRQHTEKPLNLELCDNFTETLINVDCTIVNIDTDLVKKISPKHDLQKNDNDDNDLVVLADAASSRKKIQHLNLQSESEDISEVCILSRNFDNLIANPLYIKSEEDVKIEQIEMLVLTDENVIEQMDATFSMD